MLQYPHKMTELFKKKSDMGASDLKSNLNKRFGHESYSLDLI